MKQRYTNIDLLRITASFMVLFLHVAWAPYNVPIDSMAGIMSNFGQSATRSCVPLFVMISGMLIMQREELSLKKLFLKSIPRLVWIHILWTVLYTVHDMGHFDLLRNFDPVAFLKEAWQWGVGVHMWYLPMIIGIYLLSPVLHAIRDKQKVLKYTIYLFIALCVLRSTLAAFPLTYPLAELMTRYSFPMAVYSGYFILGYVLSTNQDKIKIKSVVLIIVLVAICLLTGLIIHLRSLTEEDVVLGLYDNFFISTFLEACIIFLLFLRIPSQKIDATWNKTGWVQKVSKYTLFTYLLHPFVVQHLQWDLNISSVTVNALLYVPVASVVIFVFCLGVAYVIDLIPGVRKILL